MRIQNNNKQLLATLEQKYTMQIEKIKEDAKFAKKRTISAQEGRALAFSSELREKTIARSRQKRLDLLDKQEQQIRREERELLAQAEEKIFAQVIANLASEGPIDEQLAAMKKELEAQTDEALSWSVYKNAKIAGATSNLEYLGVRGENDTMLIEDSIEQRLTSVRTMIRKHLMEHIRTCQ